MNIITNLIDDYLQNEIPGKKSVRQKYADEALEQYTTLVFERDQAQKDLEDLRVSFAHCVKMAKEYEDRCNGFAVEDVFFQQIISTASPKEAQEVLAACLLQENCLGCRLLPGNRVQCFWPCDNPPATWVNSEVLQKQLPEGYTYVCIPKNLQAWMLGKKAKSQ